MPIPAPTVARHLATLRAKLAAIRADPEARAADTCGPALRAAIHGLETWRASWAEYADGLSEAEAAGSALCFAGAELHARLPQWATRAAHPWPEVADVLRAIAADAAALAPDIGAGWLAADLPPVGTPEPVGSV